MAEPFQSAEEFREVFDKTFRTLSEDEGLGGPLKAADIPQSFYFEDLQLVAHLRPSREGEEGQLVWKWGDPEWEPRVRMTMTSETANRYFQGKENVTVAIATKRIKTGGDVKAALGSLPLAQPVIEQYSAIVAADYPHLALQ
jgi:hypothetical protein